MTNLKIKIANMEGRSRRPVANQFRLDTEDGQYFQSYQSVIAFRPNDKQSAFYKINSGKSLFDCNLKAYPRIYLDKNTWDYSRTTSKYRIQFIGEGTEETRAKIKSGEYQLIDLN